MMVQSDGNPRQKGFQRIRWGSACILIAFVMFLFLLSLFGNTDLLVILGASDKSIKTTEASLLSSSRYTASSSSTTSAVPQQLVFGAYFSESAAPFLSSDVWVELLLDNPRAFFVRPYEEHYPLTEAEWMTWFNTTNYAVTIVMNNQLDHPWPHPQNSFTTALLDHERLHRLYVVNPKISHDKVHPLPIGLKWQMSTINLYGESKKTLKNVYTSVSESAQDTKSLFMDQGRTETVWVRYMTDTNGAGSRRNYGKTNPALATLRSDVASILLNATATTTNSTFSSNHTTLRNGNVVIKTDKMKPAEYFAELKRHRFVASPAGNGLDTHTTWEALLAGCIPIVPHSTLDAGIFRHLPIWLIHDWNEVTKEAIANQSAYMRSRTDEFQWETLFAGEWWKREFSSS